MDYNKLYAYAAQSYAEAGEQIESNLERIADLHRRAAIIEESQALERAAVRIRDDIKNLKNESERDAAALRTLHGDGNTMYAQSVTNLRKIEWDTARAKAKVTAAEVAVSGLKRYMDFLTACVYREAGAKEGTER
jgi:predicted  nucleic acid-binding Zn-ribbon protein